MCTRLLAPAAPLLQPKACYPCTAKKRTWLPVCAAAPTDCRAEMQEVLRISQQQFNHKQCVVSATLKGWSSAGSSQCAAQQGGGGSAARQEGRLWQRERQPWSSQQYCIHPQAYHQQHAEAWQQNGHSLCHRHQRIGTVCAPQGCAQQTCSIRYVNLPCTMCSTLIAHKAYKAIHCKMPPLNTTTPFPLP